jgi:hypothetical protein
MLREIVQMGYKNRTPEVQIFLGYKPFKWGTVPPNGVRMATLLEFHSIILSFIELKIITLS